MSENDLIKIIPNFDAWIIGDDPATERVFNAGKNLKIAVKWGIGIDNIDIEACKKYNIKFTNTPGMFGEEVSDIAIGYLIMLSRELHIIDQKVRNNVWYKPCGLTLKDKNVGVLGYGNIGQTVVRKLKAFEMNIKIYDPFYNYCQTLEELVTNIDYLVITCPLTKETYHCINEDIISLMNKDSFIINVSRGQVIYEKDLIKMLDRKHLRGVALDVFEIEPLEENSKLKEYNCVFGSHNGSNTIEAVNGTNKKVIDYIVENI